jgi:serine/threonine protein kinase
MEWRFGGSYVIIDDVDRNSRADHLAQFQELLGKIPKSVALSGRYSLELFNRKGELRNIRKLKFWDLKSVLSEKYKMSTEEAESLAAFLQPMLDFDPEKRAKAGEMLKNPWLTQSSQPRSESQPAVQRSCPEEVRGSTVLPSSPSVSDEARRRHVAGEAAVGAGQDSPPPAPITPNSGSGLPLSTTSTSEPPAPVAAGSQRVGSGSLASAPQEESTAGAASIPGGGASSRSPIRQVTQLLGSISFHSSGQATSSVAQQSPPNSANASDAQGSGSSRRLVNPRLTSA